MKVNLTLDDLNILVYRYLLENGYTHTAFTFSNEAYIHKNPYYSTHSFKMPTNALISFMQKAMIYVYLEYHTDEATGTKIPCDESFSLFRKHNCYRKVGDNNGYPIEREEKVPENQAQIQPTSHIYVGPPHRRLQDKWLLSGYYKLYSPENTTAALTNWNPTNETQLLTISVGGPSFVSYEAPNKGYSYRALELPGEEGAQRLHSTVGAFRHDGAVLATGYEDGKCCIWSSEGALLETLTPFNSPITAISFSGNVLNPETSDDKSERLSIGSSNGDISIYELAVSSSFKLLNTINISNYILHIAWRDHTVLTVVSSNLETKATHITLYDTKTLNNSDLTPPSEDLANSSSHNSFIKTVWDKEGQNIAIVGDILYIHCTHSCTSFPLDHRDRVIDANWVYGMGDKSNKRIVTCSADKIITLWDVSNRCAINTAILDHIPTSMSLCNNDMLLAVATFGAIINIYALPGFILRCSIQESKPVTHISWSSDNNSICYNLYKSGDTIVLPMRIFSQYE